MANYAGATTGGVATIQPCSFALDCEWARTIIDRLAEGVKRIGTVIRRGCELFSKAVEAFFRWWPDSLIPPAARNLIKVAINLLGRLIEKVCTLEARVLSTMKQLLGPWEIRSAGQNILDCLAPKTFEFADTLQTSKLGSSRTWQSDASRDFFSAVDRQHGAAQSTAEATKKFGTGVKQLGDDAVKATTSFITDFIQAVAGIAVAALAIPTVVGTVPAASAIMNLIREIISAIIVLVKTAQSIGDQAAAFATTAAGAVPGGSWPDDVNG